MLADLQKQGKNRMGPEQMPYLEMACQTSFLRSDLALKTLFLGPNEIL
jgi:hypothetical protein